MVNSHGAADLRSLCTITNPYRPPATIHTDMKPIDYVGLYLIVITSSPVTINMLYRMYY